MSREVWDAYDKYENLLGFDLIRNEPIRNNIYHIVVEIYAVTENNEILMTLRHPDKPFGLKWEVTGGSILKGETPLEGAVRELKEETGIEVKESDLLLVSNTVYRNRHVIFKSYVTFINKEKTTIKLQEGESIDYRFIPYDEFKEFIKTSESAGSIKERFYSSVDIFDKLILDRQPVK